MIQGNVKERMEEAGVSVRQLVKMTGVSSCTVHRARGEGFQNCTIKTLAKIASALGCRVRDLFTE